MQNEAFQETLRDESKIRRILCVEDDFDSGELIRFLLGKENSDYEVTVVSTAAEAEKQIADNRFDLFVFDYCLPSKSGIQLCRQIRRTDFITPIIFYSAMGRETDRKLAVEAGASEYLVKPLDFEKFTETVKNFLIESPAV